MITSLSILGSTGSIGTQTLEVAKHLGLRVAGLSAGRNITLLEQQIRFFNPTVVSVEREKDAHILKERLSDYPGKVEVMHGREGNLAIATLPDADFVMASMVGVAGLQPVMAALAADKTVGLANKETLVAGGDLVMPMVQAGKGRLYPVDSEHSAIWQCLMGTPAGSLDRILLTASGGPFRGWSRKQLAEVTVSQALNHPTWRMGGKITIDSATMMNKGLEVIEAMHLFQLPVDRIDVVVHPQSIIHSMVEFVDNSVIAQLGAPDMRLPIQYALNYPHRTRPVAKPLNLLEISKLTFEAPDRETFRALDLAYTAGKRGGLQTAVMNSANEEAVALFLENQIHYHEIVEVVEQAMDAYRNLGEISLEKVISAHDEVKMFVRNKMKR
jgi:1-deoxy-D-xylulose-5-phosphate reductoisomerase